MMAYVTFNTFVDTLNHYISAFKEATQINTIDIPTGNIIPPELSNSFYDNITTTIPHFTPIQNYNLAINRILYNKVLNQLLTLKNTLSLLNVGYHQLVTSENETAALTNLSLTFIRPIYPIATRFMRHDDEESSIFLINLFAAQLFELSQYVMPQVSNFCQIQLCQFMALFDNDSMQNVLRDSPAYKTLSLSQKNKADDTWVKSIIDNISTYKRGNVQFFILLGLTPSTPYKMKLPNNEQKVLNDFEEATRLVLSNENFESYVTLDNLNSISDHPHVEPLNKITRTWQYIRENINTYQSAGNIHLKGPDRMTLNSAYRHALDLKGQTISHYIKLYFFNKLKEYCSLLQENTGSGSQRASLFHESTHKDKLKQRILDLYKKDRSLRPLYLKVDELTNGALDEALQANIPRNTILKKSRSF